MPHPTPDRTPSSEGRRRWPLALLVGALAWLAALGNAPGPGLTMVRSVSVGGHAPRVTVNHRHVQVTLPGDATYRAVAFWAYGRDEPALVVQARDPQQRALPRALSIERSPRELTAHPAAFEVSVAPGSLGRAVDYGQQVGWYAVQLWHVGGAVSAVFFESARQMPRGYLSCGSGKVVRDDLARGLAPGTVKAAFLEQFSRYKLPALSAPGAEPPRSKAVGPAAAPPPGKGLTP